jgi:hypothetical protein
LLDGSGWQVTHVIERAGRQTDVEDPPRIVASIKGKVFDACDTGYPQMDEQRRVGWLVLLEALLDQAP